VANARASPRTSDEGRIGAPATAAGTTAIPCGGLRRECTPHRPAQRALGTTHPWNRCRNNQVPYGPTWGHRVALAMDDVGGARPTPPAHRRHHPRRNHFPELGPNDRTDDARGSLILGRGWRTCATRIPSDRLGHPDEWLQRIGAIRMRWELRDPWSNKAHCCLTPPDKERFFRNNFFYGHLCDRKPEFASAPPGHQTPSSAWWLVARCGARAQIHFRGLCH